MVTCQIFHCIHLKIGGIRYKTSEDYFQSKKMLNNSDRDLILGTDSLLEVFRLGQTLPMVSYWNSKYINSFGYGYVRSFSLGESRVVKVIEYCKDKVMLDGLFYKFGYHADICKSLLSTGDKILVEASRKDSYWGTGLDGKYINRLGILLQYVRDSIRLW